MDNRNKKNNEKMIPLGKKGKLLEMPGFEPGAFRMRSGHSTTELHPHRIRNCSKMPFFKM